MATPFTLTPQPIRVTSVSRQPMYLAVDLSQFDGLDVEAVCAVEGTATNAALNLFTGMQTDTDDGWIVPTSNFSAISGTGQQVVRVSIGSGLLQYLRWDVSSLGGATSLTFFIRGIARLGLSNGAARTDPTIGWSLVNYCNINGGNLITFNGTVGQRFWFTTPVSITGARFYWAGGSGAKTVKVTLWDAANTVQGTANIAVNAAGVYTVSFSTVTVGASLVYKQYQIGAYETTGTYYTNTTTAASRPGAGNSDVSFLANPYLFNQIVGVYKAGDGAPDSVNTTQYFPVEPIYTLP